MARDPDRKPLSERGPRTHSAHGIPQVPLRTNSKRPAVPCRGTNRDGTPCKNFAIIGLEVCTKHGGAAKRARNAAKVRIADEQARRVLTRLGEEIRPVENHLEALRKVAGETIAFKNWCREQAQKVAENPRYESEQGFEQLRSEIALYERAQDRCATVIAQLARVDIDSRLAAVEEAKAVMMAEALAKSLAKAGISGEVANAVRREFAKRLVVIASPEPPQQLAG